MAVTLERGGVTAYVPGTCALSSAAWVVVAAVIGAIAMVTGAVTGIAGSNVIPGY